MHGNTNRVQIKLLLLSLVKVGMDWFLNGCIKTKLTITEFLPVSRPFSQKVENQRQLGGCHVLTNQHSQAITRTRVANLARPRKQRGALYNWSSKYKDKCYHISFKLCKRHCMIFPQSYLQPFRVLVHNVSSLVISFLFSIPHQKPQS